MTELVRAYAHAAAVTRDKARSFHFASMFLPAAKRQAVFALYDYCRHADDLVDERGERPVPEVEAELAELAALVEAIARGGEAPPRWIALQDTMNRFEVPPEPLLELLRGLAGDLDPKPMPDETALLLYCHQVAGVVGLMLGPVLGARTREFDGLGAALGVAMQLTNVLRDVAPDRALGRCYLPADELAAAGLGAADLERVSPAWREYATGYIARARRYYAMGEQVVPLFPADGSALTVRLMARTYAGILADVERRDYDVFSGRAHVGPWGKLRIMTKALLQPPASRVPTAAQAP